MRDLSEVGKALKKENVLMLITGDYVIYKKDYLIENIDREYRKYSAEKVLRGMIDDEQFVKAEGIRGGKIPGKDV